MGWIQCNRRAEMGLVAASFEDSRSAPRTYSLANGPSECSQTAFAGCVQPAGIIAGTMVSCTHPPIAQSTPRRSVDLPLCSPPEEEGLDVLLLSWLFEPEEDGCPFSEEDDEL